MVPKTTLLKKNLEKEKVLINEDRTTNLYDPYITLEYVPEEMGLGNNLIKFKVNSYNLEPGSNINFEAIDQANNPIYVKPLLYSTQNSRYLSVRIDDKTSDGPGKLIVILKAKRYPNNSLIDPKLNSTFAYNVRYTFPIYVNKTVENDSLIVFSNKPNIDISEKIVPNYKSYPENQNNVVNQSGSITYKLTRNNIPYIAANGFNFTNDMINSTLRVNSVSNAIPPTSSGYFINNMSSSIVEIINATTARLDQPFRLTSNQNNKIYTFTDFLSTSHSFEYKVYNSQSEMPRSQSFLKIDASNLTPDSGKIDKIRVYVNNKSVPSDEYKLVSSTDVVVNNLLTDSTSNQLDNDIGYITTQSKVTQYYEALNLITNGSSPNTLIYDSASLFNSMTLIYGGAQTVATTISPKSQYAINFVPGDYNLQFKLLGYVDAFKPGNPNLVVVMSGSAFKSNLQDLWRGKVIANIDQTEQIRNYGTISYDFNVPTTGSGVVKFIYNRGNFNIADIKITPKIQPGSNPSSTRQYIPLNLENRFDDLKFKFEFVNRKGDISDITINKTLLSYTGSNSYINGNDNQLFGKLFASNTAGAGLQIVGDRNGGYISSQDSSTGSGLFMFDYKSGSQVETIKNHSNIENNVGFDLYADNGDYLTFRAHGPNAGLVSSLTSGSGVRLSGGSQMTGLTFSGTASGFFDTNISTSGSLVFNDMTNMVIYYVLIRNTGSLTATVTLPASSSYDVRSVSSFTMGSNTFRELSAIKTPSKRIWQVSEELQFAP